MDVASPSAPPVVAVVVVHEPGDWFDETLAGLRDQEYPNLRTLFLVAGDETGVAERIHAVLPDAHVRPVPGNPGFGSAANEAMRLVEGSGLFCFLHDDVALDPDAMTRLVEELYRSNAGIVGPKLVEWDRPQVLQQVGVAIDRFGEPDPVVEPGEVDQEQHDAVRDVFALSSACVLVRADLFRTLGGFDDAVDFHGDGLDLCWRAHLGGARVLVVPAARARHRGQLTERRPDLAHRRRSARHRVRSVATLTGRWRTPVVLAQLVVVSVVEIVVGVFTGRARDGLASLYALGRLVPSLPSVIARRRTMRPLRLVPDHEVAAMQLRGSARLSGFLRHREEIRQRQVRQFQDDDVVREAGDRQPTTVALILLVALIVGSRRLIADGVPRLGEFVGLPEPGAALRSFVSAWHTGGFGSDSPNPPALALAALSGFVGLGRTGLVSTALVVLPFVLGPLGVWHALSFVPSVRARLGSVIVYAAVPLAPAAVASGRWGVLVVHAALPWALLVLRLAGGLTVFQRTQWGDDEIADAVASVPPRMLVRLIATLALLDAVVGAFVPSFPLLVVAVAVALAIGTLLAGGARSILTAVVVSVVAFAVSFVLLEPWSFDVLGRGWSAFVGRSGTDGLRLGAGRIASFRIGPTALGVASLAFYVPALAAPLIGRGWRLTWAARGGVLAGTFLLLALLDDRGALPVALPEPGVLLVPVALGLAIAAACALAGFEHDILGARFGWRQPLGLAVSIALFLGVFQGVVSIASGRWSAPRLGLPAYLSQLPEALPGLDDGGVAGGGDGRILFVGEAGLLPVPGVEWRDGVSFAVTDSPEIELTDLFAGKTGDGEQLTAEALEAIAAETTDRAGRLLAPLAIRYVVVPLDDGVRSGRPVAPPEPVGLLDALGRQFDLRRVDSPNVLVIYENTAWLPMMSILDAAAADASAEAGGALAARSIGTGAGVFTAERFERPAIGDVPAGPLNLAYPDDGGWLVELDGAAIDPRPSFGWSLVADLPAAGRLEVARERGPRTVLLLLQVLMIVAVAIVATGARPPRLRPRRGSVEPVTTVGPLLEFGSGPPPGTAFIADEPLPTDDDRLSDADPFDDDGSFAGDASFDGGESIDELLADLDRRDEDRP